MKGRGSSYSTASGAVIFLSKWAVFVSGPWEGDFQLCWEAVCCDWFKYTADICTGPDTQKTHSGRCRWCFMSVPLHGEGRENVFGVLISATNTPFSLSHTHTHKPTHKPAFAWSRISHIVILRPSLHYRGHDHTRLHVCAWPKAKNREMNRDVYMKEFYVTYPRGSICTVHLREKRHSEKKQIEVARVSQWLFVGKEAACNSQQPEVIIFKYVLRI